MWVWCHHTLVGLVESVDTGVAENAKKLWLGETPTAAKHGEVGRGRNRDRATNSIQGGDTAESTLARLKRDHSDTEVYAARRGPPGDGHNTPNLTVHSGAVNGYMQSPTRFIYALLERCGVLITPDRSYGHHDPN